jgi:molecular chaperone DnaK
MTFQIEKAMNDAGDKLTEDEEKPVQEALDKLKEAVKDKKYDELDALMKAVTDAWYPLAAKMYQGNTSGDTNPFNNFGGFNPGA